MLESSWVLVSRVVSTPNKGGGGGYFGILGFMGLNPELESMIVDAAKEWSRAPHPWDDPSGGCLDLGGGEGGLGFSV